MFTIITNFKLALSAKTVVQVSFASDSKPVKYTKEMVKKGLSAFCRFFDFTSCPLPLTPVMSRASVYKMIIVERAASVNLWPMKVDNIRHFFDVHVVKRKDYYYYYSYYYYYYYYYYLLQLSFHSVAVVFTLVTNKNKYT